MISTNNLIQEHENYYKKYLARVFEIDYVYLLVDSLCFLCHINFICNQFTLYSWLSSSAFGFVVISQWFCFRTYRFTLFVKCWSNTIPNPQLSRQYFLFSFWASDKCLFGIRLFGLQLLLNDMNLHQYLLSLFILLY